MSDGHALRMGLLDKMKLDKVKKAAADNRDKIDKGIDKAAAMAEKRAGGKQASRVRQVADKAKDAVDKLADDKRKDQPGPAPDGTTGPRPTSETQEPPSRINPTGEPPSA